jgi:hypothetical protein
VHTRMRALILCSLGIAAIGCVLLVRHSNFGPLIAAPDAIGGDGSDEVVSDGARLSAEIVRDSRVDLGPPSTTNDSQSNSNADGSRAKRPSSAAAMRDRIGSIGADTSPAVHPVTSEQREAFIAQAIASRAANIHAICHSEIPTKEKSRIPAELDETIKAKAYEVIARLSSAEYEYQTRLNDAIISEVRNSDLSGSAWQSRAKGVKGTIGGAAAGPPWGRGAVKIEAKYMIEFSKYPDVEAASERLRIVRSEWKRLLKSLPK